MNGLYFLGGCIILSVSLLFTARAIFNGLDNVASAIRGNR
jgi:hypothetical protein